MYLFGIINVGAPPLGAVNILYDLKILESIKFLFELTFKQELDRLEYLKVINKVNRSQWGAPTFLIPKKDSTVRFISDYIELSKRQPYPINNI